MPVCVIGSFFVFIIFDSHILNFFRFYSWIALADRQLGTHRLLDKQCLAMSRDVEISIIFRGRKVVCEQRIFIAMAFTLYTIVSLSFGWKCGPPVFLGSHTPCSRVWIMNLFGWHATSATSMNHTRFGQITGNHKWIMRSLARAHTHSRNDWRK